MEKHWAIIFDSKTNQKIKQFISTWQSEFERWDRFVWSDKFHVSLSQDNTLQVNKQFQSLQGYSVKLILEHVASTLFIAAIKVKVIPTLHLTEENLHLTLGYIPGIRPILANSLWDLYKNDIQIKNLENLEISGRIELIEK